MSDRLVKSGQRKQREEIVKLVPANLTGSLASTLAAIPEGTYHCQALTSGTGLFQITLNPAFGYARAPVPVFTALHATAKLFCTLTSVTTTTIIFRVYSDAGVLTDPTSIHVIIVGCDTVDQL